MENIIRIIGSTIIGLFIGLNALLALFDPFGVEKLYNANFKQGGQGGLFMEHPHIENAWIARTGQYDIYENYSFEINDNGYRVVRNNAESKNASCRVGVIGDSVTFGMSAPTNWVNILANQYEDVHFKNFAHISYDASQLKSTMQYVRSEYDLDIIIIMTVGNDVKYSGSMPQPRESVSFAQHLSDLFPLVRHIMWFRAQWSIRQKINDASTKSDGQADRDTLYYRFMRETSQNDDTLIIAFDRDYAPNEAIEINHYLDEGLVVSFADIHPNREGHQYIADQIEPHLNQKVSDLC